MDQDYQTPKNWSVKIKRYFKRCTSGLDLSFNPDALIKYLGDFGVQYQKVRPILKRLEVCPAYIRTRQFRKQIATFSAKGRSVEQSHLLGATQVVKELYLDEVGRNHFDPFPMSKFKYYEPSIKEFGPDTRPGRFVSD